MSEVVLDRLTKTYPGVVAVDDVSLEIERGELISLLGPSGCGKTTTLRMIAGFIVPSAGLVLIRDQDVTARPPYKRDTGMVFQNYALFPHLTVFDNIAFGLRRRRVNQREIQSRVGQMIELLQLNGLDRRYPRQLSGGQQQRVAVGRALVINPAVILLDEPFSNLDAMLRASTRIELRRLQQELKLTAIFVTHDQEEAMAISDRIVVMNRGRIEQLGTTQDIYEQPATAFVASFMGAANVFPGKVLERSNGNVRVRLHAGVDVLADPSAGLAPDAPVVAIIRAEAVKVGPPETERPGMNSARGRVEVASYLGATGQLVVRLAGDETIVARTDNRAPQTFQSGSEVELIWDRDAVHVFPA